MRFMMAALLVGVIACDGGDDSGEDSTSGDSFSPEEGPWEADEISTVDTCGFFDDDGKGGDTGGDDDELVTLTVTGETSFNLTDGTDEFNIDCTIAGDQTFTCDGGTESQSLAKDGLDASINSTFSYSGTFSSGTEGTIALFADVSCDGGDCTLIVKHLGIEFPCSVTQELAISFAG